MAPVNSKKVPTPATNPSKVRKGVVKKRVRLSVAQKLQLIAKLEAGASVQHVCLEYGIAKQTVSDIKKSKPSLLKWKGKGCRSQQMVPSAVVSGR